MEVDYLNYMHCRRLPHIRVMFAESYIDMDSYAPKTVHTFCQERVKVLQGPNNFVEVRREKGMYKDNTYLLQIVIMLY